MTTETTIAQILGIAIITMAATIILRPSYGYKAIKNLIENDALRFFFGTAKVTIGIYTLIQTSYVQTWHYYLAFIATLLVLEGLFHLTAKKETEQELIKNGKNIIKIASAALLLLAIPLLYFGFIQ